MRFLTLNQCPNGRPDAEFNESITGRIVVLAVFAAIGAASLIAGRQGYVPGWSYAVATFCVLAVLTAASMLRRALTASNWLMRVTGDRMCIKFRSYLNDRFSSDEIQIVELDRPEVAWVRPVKVRVTIEDEPSADTKYSGLTIKYLEIGLTRPDAYGLDQRLRNEEHHPPVGNRFITSKTSHNPVTVLDDSTIRICFRDASSCVAPKLEKAVDFLSRWTETRPEDKQEVSYTISALGSLPTEQQNAKLRQLSALDQMAAVKLTRRLKGCSLHEAVQFVEAL